MTISASLLSQIADLGTYISTDALLNPTSQPIFLQNAYKMQYGATANDANDTTTVITKYFEGKKTVTISSSILDIDLTQLVNTFGNVLNFSKIYRFVLHNNDLSGGSGCIIGGAASNAWVAPFNGSATAKKLCPAGGDEVWSSPYLGFNVTAGSKVLRLQNDAVSPTGPLSVNLHIWGS